MHRLKDYGPETLARTLMTWLIVGVSLRSDIASIHTVIELAAGALVGSAAPLASTPHASR